MLDLNGNALGKMKRSASIRQMTEAELKHRDAMRSTDTAVIERARILCEESAISLTECGMEGQAKTLLKKVKELEAHVLVVTGKRKPKKPKKARE